MKAFIAFSKLDLKQAMTRLTTTAILAWMFFFFAAAPSSAAEAKVNFAYSALDASYTAYWMAVEKGFFERYGVALGKSVYISGASILMGSSGERRDRCRARSSQWADECSIKRRRHHYFLRLL